VSIAFVRLGWRLCMYRSCLVQCMRRFNRLVRVLCEVIALGNIRAAGWSRGSKRVAF